MKIFKHASGVLVESEGKIYPMGKLNWDKFINDDGLLPKLKRLLRRKTPLEDPSRWLANGLQAPIQGQEIWASGVTWYNSKLARQEESEAAGGGDFYARVYSAERPELFYKGNAQRCAGPGEVVRIRRDSEWNVPEPELTLCITSSGKIVGYTIGNDMSSRSIEGENPLYLPQAKTYDGSAALGPCIWVCEEPLPSSTEIQLIINRGEEGRTFEGNIRLEQMKRKPEELVAWLFREMSFPQGCFLMTGTGIVPPREFTLAAGDEIQIRIEPMGILRNVVG